MPPKKELTDTHLNYILSNVNLIEERNHTHLFDIIEKSGCKFTENDNGVFIRLNQLSLACIWEIYDYIYKNAHTIKKQNSTELFNTQGEKIIRCESDNNSECNEKTEPHNFRCETTKTEEPTKNELTFESKTETFLKNDIEIDTWKKEIIMRLKNKAKK
jgi:hypothetical protein